VKRQIFVKMKFTHPERMKFNSRGRAALRVAPESTDDGATGQLITSNRGLRATLAHGY